MAYIPGSRQIGMRRISWVDRSGNVQPVDLPPALFNDIRLSPDGSRAAVALGTSGSADIWIHDFGRRTYTRLTFTGTNATPLWSPDGTTIVYASIEHSTGRKTTIYRVPSDGSREPVEIMTVPTRLYLSSMSRDGGTVFADWWNVANAGKTDVRRIPLAPDAEPKPIASTRFDEYAPALSPDGKWIAYQSDETSRDEVYVRDATGAGGRWQISTDGGEEPNWSPDGRELYYRSDTRLMVVPVESGSGFKAGQARILFDGVYRMRSDTNVSYDVDPKGGRFLMIRPADEEGSDTSIRIVLDWLRELKRLESGSS
jgi:protease II